MSNIIVNKMVYRLAKTYNDTYFKHDGVEFYIYALVASKAEPKLLGFKQVKSVPKEISGDLSAEEKEKVAEVGKAGHLWFYKLEKKGWNWNSGQKIPKGAQDVQDALNYLKRFKAKDKVGGVEVIYVEINNKNL